MSLIQKLLALPCIVAMFYFNLDATITTLGLRFKKRVPGTPSILPNHWTFFRLFAVYDVFDKWSTRNYGYRAYGLKERTDKIPILPTAEMVNLEVYDYFPQILGEANRKLWLQSYRNNPKRLLLESVRLCSQIQRLYNKNHPDDPVVQVVIYRYEWDKDPASHYAKIDTATIYVDAHN